MRTVFRTISSYINYMRLKPKFFMICLFSAFIPFVIYIIILFSISTKFTKSEKLGSMDGTMETLSVTISNQIEMVKRSTSLFLSDENTRELLQIKPYNYDYDQQIILKSNTGNIISYIEQETYIKSVRIYIPEEYTYLLDGSHYFSNTLICDTDWYQTLSQYAGKSLWITRSSADLSEIAASYATKVINLNDYHASDCTICIDFSVSKLQSLLSEANAIEKGSYYITCEDGSILISSDGLPSSTEKLSISTGKWTEQENTYTKAIPLEKCSWYLVAVVPASSLQESSAMISIIYYILIISLSCILIAIVSFSFTTSITQRISILSTAMNSISHNKQLAYVTTVQGHDEINELTEGYNYMVSELKGMIEREYLAGISQKNAEFRALRAQINPHFLYNTLETINYFAEENDSEQVNRIISALSSFYKLSLSGGHDYHKINEEISLCNAYMEIQNIRYENAIHFEQHIPSNLYEYLIPKILLQPLIENAIIHGIFEKCEKKGSVFVGAEETDRDIVFSIRDDGVGIAPDILLKLNNGEDISSAQNVSSNRYGISNINERLCSAYGMEYRLIFSSELGKGTTVFVRIAKKIPRQ